MRKLCVFIGFAALGYRLDIAGMFSLLLMRSTAAESINVLVGAFTAAWLIASHRLAERVASASWIVAGFGAVGAVAILGKSFSGFLSLPLLLTLGIAGSSVMSSALDAALLLCLLKVMADLTPAPAIVPAADPRKEPLFRIFLAIVLFIVTTFDFVPTGIALAGALSAQSLAALNWMVWLEWGIAAVIACGFIAYTKIGERLSDSPPGLNLMTLGLVVHVVLAALMYATVSTSFRDFLPVLLIGAVFIAPIAIGANALLAIGLFRVLFNLPSREQAVDLAAVEPWPSEPLDAQAEPTPGAPAKPSAPDLTQAVVQARANLAAKPGDSMLHQQLHQRLLADPSRQAEMLDHAREYLAVLLKQSNGALALKTLQTCVERDPAFKPSAEQVVPLAKIAMSSGQAALALRIMNQFDRLNPGHASTPSVYFLSARALRDMKQLEQARQVLDGMLARFPDDPLAPDARALRKGLERP